MHDIDPVREMQHFRKLGGHEHNCGAGFDKRSHEVIDFDLGADIDPNRRFVEQKYLEIARQSSRQHHLLAIAAGEIRDRALRIGRPQLQPLDDLPREPPLGAATDPAEL